MMTLTEVTAAPAAFFVVTITAALGLGWMWFFVWMSNGDRTKVLASANFFLKGVLLMLCSFIFYLEAWKRMMDSGFFSNLFIILVILLGATVSLFLGVCGVIIAFFPKVGKLKL